MSPVPAGELARFHPLGDLSPERLGEIARAVREVRLLAGENVPVLEGTDVALVRSGTLECRVSGGRADLLLPGDWFGLERLLEIASPDAVLAAVSDAVIWVVAGPSMAALFETGQSEYFLRAAERLRDHCRRVVAARDQERSDPFLILRVADVSHAPPLFVDRDMAAADAAGRMLAERTSVCLVRDGRETVGIVTERDMLAVAALPVAGMTVGDIMTAPIITVSRSELLVEAFSKMVRGSIRRLVVTDDDGSPAGVLEERDLLAARGENPVYLSGEIAAAPDVAALARTWARVKAMALRAVAEGAHMAYLGRVVSDLTDRMLCRALALALTEAGRPQAAGFALVALGSEARHEQYLATDMDNAMIITEAEDGPFFLALGGRIIEMLLAAGLPACPKGIMARDPEWNRPLFAWMNRVDDLVQAADAEAFLTVPLLADMRHVAGDPALTGRLRDYLLKRVKASPVMLRYLAREALRFTPPIGFFGNLSVERSGPGKGALDIKKGGIFPLVLGVKTLALDHGLVETGTIERLTALSGLGVLSEALSGRVAEAFHHFQALRAARQAEAMRQNGSPDNWIRPEVLSAADRERLKESLKVVVEFQEIIYNKYGLRLLT